MVTQQDFIQSVDLKIIPRSKAKFVSVEIDRNMALEKFKYSSRSGRDVFRNVARKVHLDVMNVLPFSYAGWLLSSLFLCYSDLPAYRKQSGTTLQTTRSESRKKGMSARNV